ncbi:MAG: hypothetical protein HZB26_09755 [Candidatus Hydrogenedentes bacterium]|nr:hypothetical protein [Candidatus Hydrogenedentota bacterium]
MIMADVFKILFLILGTLVTVVCYWLLFEACAPARVDRARRNYERRPIRITLLGLLVSAPVIAIGMAMVSAPAGLAKVIGLTLIMLLVLSGLLGSAGLTRMIGQRLESAVDSAQPWRRVLRGGVVLAVSFVMPFIGWFLVLPFALISGVGATICRAPASPAPQPAPIAEPPLNAVSA